MLETAIAYEQLEIELTAALARTEPDEYVRRNMEFTLIEDFDHLYRYANLLKMLEKEEAEKLTGSDTEITVGRPTVTQHRHPVDTVRRSFDTRFVAPLTILHVLTMTAIEQQTRIFYMNQGPSVKGMLGRNLFQEIGRVEEQHVSQYETLMDPNESLFQRLVAHEYNECWLYYSLIEQETDDRLRDIWRDHLAMEVEHLQVAAGLMRRYERRDPERLFQSQMPPALTFEPNMEYIRGVLAEQVSLTSVEDEFTPIKALPENHRYFDYQGIVNREGAPSQTVMIEIMRRQGGDYRFEPAGQHPIESFRRRELAVTR